jgi:hypothetical protein
LTISSRSTFWRASAANQLPGRQHLRSGALPDRSVLNRPTGTWSGGAASGSLVRRSACSAMTARLRAGLRAETRTDGALVPVMTGRSSLGRRWSRAEKRRTKEFERLREARSGAEPSEKCNQASGEVSEDAPDKRRAADRTIGLASANSPRDHARSALFLLKDRRAAWAARLVVAVASSPRMTGAVGRCLLRIPSGIGAVRRARCSRPSIGAGKPDEQEPVRAAARREALAGQGDEDDEACRGRSLWRARGPAGS